MTACLRSSTRSKVWLSTCSSAWMSAAFSARRDGGCGSGRGTFAQDGPPLRVNLLHVHPRVGLLLLQLLLRGGKKQYYNSYEANLEELVRHLGLARRKFLGGNRLLLFQQQLFLRSGVERYRYARDRI